MKPTALLLFAGTILASSLSAQKPTIGSGGILNVASYAYPGLPGSAIAQGSLFVVFGTNMGPASIQYAPSLPLGPALAGTSLSVTVNGTTTTPLLVYTSAGQLCALLPSNTPIGTGTLTVSYNSQSSASAPVTVAQSSVGIFSTNQKGSGPGVVTSLKYVPASLTAAASAGDIDIIWATGVGPAGNTGSEAAGTAPVSASIPVPKVYVGGVAAQVVSAARSGSPGLDQIAFTVPAGVTGCHVPVVVQSANAVSNFVTMAIGTGGFCSDPIGTGLTPGQLTQLQNQGSVSIGGIDLTRSSTAISIPGFTLPPTLSDFGSASFSKYTFDQYANSLGGITVTTYGACTVYLLNGMTTSAPVDPVTPLGLDAGTITVDGPGGTKTLTKQATGSYSSTLGGGMAGPLYLSAGTYTVTGSGGANVGPFTATVNVAAPLAWTNASSISTVTRANGQSVTWTGGDPAGITVIEGFSFGGSADNTVGAGFYCTAKTSDGQFTVPPVVLLSLPATPAGGVSSGFIGFLGVGATSALKQFTASGLDFGTIEANAFTLQSAAYN